MDQPDVTELTPSEETETVDFDLRETKEIRPLSRTYSFPKLPLKIMKRMDEARLAGPGLCDVSIIVQDDVFYAHRVVLAGCSEYFSRLFRDSDNSLHRLTSFELTKISAPAMEIILSYMYCGMLTLSWVYVVDVMDAASKLKIPAVYQAGCDFMQTKLRAVEKFLEKRGAAENENEVGGREATTAGADYASGAESEPDQSVITAYCKALGVKTNRGELQGEDDGSAIVEDTMADSQPAVAAAAVSQEREGGAAAPSTASTPKPAAPPRPRAPSGGGSGVAKPSISQLNGRLFPCNECSQVFLHYPSLVSHMKTSHQAYSRLNHVLNKTRRPRAPLSTAGVSGVSIRGEGKSAPFQVQSPAATGPPSTELEGAASQTKYTARKSVGPHRSPSAKSTTQVKEEAVVEVVQEELEASSSSDNDNKLYDPDWGCGGKPAKKRGRLAQPGSAKRPPPPSQPAATPGPGQTGPGQTGLAEEMMVKEGQLWG